jgi:hypothetical protein
MHSFENSTYTFSLYLCKRMKYNIKVPFGCKIFKFNKNRNKSEKILNFNETIVVKYRILPSGNCNQSRIDNVTLNLNLFE